MSERPDDPFEVHHVSLVEAELRPHTVLPDTTPSKWLDQVIVWVGQVASVFWLAVVAVILYAVVARYAFGQGSVTLEEVQWHIYATVWMLGLSYTLVKDDHVRVDLFHERFGLRTQAWIEVFGILVLLLPFLVIALVLSVPYFWASYLQNEASQAPAGLANRWALKFVMPLAFSLLIVGTVSRLLKCTALLFGVPRPLPRPEPERSGGS